jgi:helicase
VKVEELANFGMPEKVIKVLKKSGLKELYPPQEDAIENGLLELVRSFIISVPTASGKTLISELLAVKSILERGGKCLYIVPLRALASEKLEDFKKYESIGIKSTISTGEYDSKDAWLAGYDIIVTTSEKADSLMRHKSEWLGDVKVLVVDEVHLINDGSRGPTLEVTIAKLLHLIPDLLVLGLSATIKNASELATWLNAILISSDWRPVTLKEGVYSNGEIFYSDSKLIEVEQIVKGEVLNLALETVKNKGQSLAFVNTRAASERFALDSTPGTKRFVSKADRKVLNGFAKEVLEALPEPTRICKRLARCIESGTAFHHAGLTARQRRTVEEAFKKNYIKVLAATPTLAAGVNLPARRVVIRDHTRYDSALGRIEIPVMEIKQMSGRAGRPKYDDYGEAIIVAKSYEERSYLLENYVLAEPESIYSKLAVESAIRTHTLATIATGYADSYPSLVEFFTKTFFAYQQETYILEDIIQKIVTFLKDEGFVNETSGHYIPTLFGTRVSELYIDPLSAVMLRDALLRAEKTMPNALSYLHAIARTQEIGTLYLRKNDYKQCMEEVYKNEERLLCEIPNQLTDPWEFEGFLSEIKTALFLRGWIDEHSEESLLENYNLGPGDIRSKVELAKWILYSLSEIGRIFKIKKSGEIKKLQLRVRHGIKEELLQLVTLRGIGRVRARKLYARGFKTLKDVRDADIRALSRVELIGKKLAENIKKQPEGKGEKTENNQENGGIEETTKEDQKTLVDF